MISFLLSCNKKNIAKKENNNQQNYKLVKQDSISIARPVLMFEEERNNNFLFFNPTSFEVIIFNNNTKKISSFNKFGQGAEEYPLLRKGSIKFLNDSIIGIGLMKKIKKYNFNGEYKGEISLNSIKGYAPIPGFHIFKDSILIIQTPYVGNPYKREFYKSTKSFLLIKNLNTNNEFREVKYFVINKDNLSNNEFHYNNIKAYPYYTTKNAYCFTNSNANHVYTFNIDSLKITDITPLHLKNYQRLKIKYTEGYSPDKHILNLYRDSSIWAIFKSKTKNYVFYNKGYTLQEITKFKKEHANFPVSETPKHRYYINCFSKNEIIDIKVPISLGVPFFADKDDTIYIRKYPTENSDLKGNTVIYVCKISKNENK